MNTEILKLDRPYEYIYCNGSIGLHVATMIVYEAKTNEDGEYQLETHSHPIVKYRNQPGGTVWNRAELSDCNVLCSEDNKHISMQKFLDFAIGATTMGLTEYDDTNEYIHNVEPVEWKGILDLNGIEIDWPIEETYGRKKPQDFFNICLIFEHNPKGSKYKYRCYDAGPRDLIFVGGVSFPFAAEFNSKKELEEKLRNCMLTYYCAFSDRDFTIKFSSMDKGEFDSVIEKVNSQEEKIRQETNEIDV